MRQLANIKRNTAIVDTPKIIGAERKDLQEKIATQKEDDLRKVKGIFKNLECPNGCVKFAQRKYKGEPVGNYLMWDGQEYEIPLYVAKYLNNNCAYPVHAQSIDADGKPCSTIGKMVNRFAFISTDFR
jgi:hypothetical protein